METAKTFATDLAVTLAIVAAAVAFFFCVFCAVATAVGVAGSFATFVGWSLAAAFFYMAGHALNRMSRH